MRIRLPDIFVGSMNITCGQAVLAEALLTPLSFLYARREKYIGYDIGDENFF
jgi:hypothetical protein